MKYAGKEDPLSWDIAYAIHKVIDESNVYKYDEHIKLQFSLICAMIDRLRDSVCFFNDLDGAPKTDGELYLFLVHSCMIHDAVKKIHEELGLKYKYEEGAGNAEYKYFRPVISDEMLKVAHGKNFPTDEKFFEYFRSLAFAHPLDTNRPRFFEKGEKRYSPFVINASGPVVEAESEQMIGVRVYSNKWPEINDLYFPFRSWMDFIKDRYELLIGVNNHIKGIVENKESEWCQKKLNRKLSTSELLRAMVGQLEIRYVSSHVLASTKEALAYYTMPLDTFTARTVESVVKYRAAIDSSIQRLCEALDDLDYESFMDILDPIVCPRPPSPEGYCGVDYQLEKIFNHFGDNDEC